MKQAFVKYNIPLQSTSSVERLFSFAILTDVPKFRSLADQMFEERVLFKSQDKFLPSVITHTKARNTKITHTKLFSFPLIIPFFSFEYFNFLIFILKTNFQYHLLKQSVLQFIIFPTT